MEIENLLDLYLTGQVELFEAILKGSPEYKKELLQYVEDTYGWAQKNVSRFHYNTSLPRSIFKNFDWFFSSQLQVFNKNKYLFEKKPKLPPFIKHIWVINTRLNEIPDYILNERILSLGITTTLDETLPNLPKYLERFSIDNCHNIKELPLLPESLTFLDCRTNQLTTLPNLPKGLTHLYCSNNPLKSFPVLPKTLELLYISETQRQLLPCDLPNCNLVVYGY